MVEGRIQIFRRKRNPVQTGGLVAGAFGEVKLKGFVSVEPEHLGTKKQWDV